MADFDAVAEVYDDIYSAFKDDIPFYKKQAKKAGGRVLEVCCGTGRVYLELLREGVDACGIDISPRMLSRLKAKAKASGLRPRVFLADMKSFSLHRKFVLVIVPFRAFLHNLTSEDQIAALRCFRRHLAPGGRLILNMFMPSAHFIVKNYGKTIPTVIDRKRRMVSFDESYFVDEPNQVIAVRGVLKKGAKTAARWNFRLALIYKKEFELLLRLAGFSKWKVYGGFKKEELVSSKQEMVWIIER